MIYTTSLGADYYDAERDEEEYLPNHDDAEGPR